MTVKEIRKKLAKLGVSVPAKARKTDLEKLLTKEEKAAEKAAKKEVEKAVEEVTEEQPAEEPKAKKIPVKVVEKVPSIGPLPVVDGVQVARILSDGHTKTHFHCYMANGTTVHVPKTKFA